MSRATVAVVVLIATLAIFGAVVVAAPKRADVPDEQPGYGGSSGQAEEQGLEETGSVVSVNATAVSGNETAISSNGTTTGSNEIATESNVTATGGNATATSYAVGGNAVVLSTAGEFAILFNNTSEEDLRILLRNLLNRFAADGAAGLPWGNATDGEKSVGGSAVVIAGKGARAVGGSAVFVGSKGGRAVGGSATVLGIVGGRLRVLRHANGETSNVSGRVASGGVVTVP